MFGEPVSVFIAAVIGYLLVVVSFLLIYRRYPRLPRPNRIGRPMLVGLLALLATVFFAVLYLPGSPSALVWPFEWAIVAFWAVVGLAFFLGARRRASTMRPAEQARRILGDYARKLEGAGR